MSQYDIRVKIDPSGVVQGRQKTEQELDRLERSANRTKSSVADVAKPLNQTSAAARTFARDVGEVDRGLGRARNMFAQTSVSVRDLSDHIVRATPNVQKFGATSQDATAKTGLLGKGASAASGIIGGVFGAAIALAGAALVDMAIKALRGSDSIDDLVKKMQEDARQTRLNEQAKAAYSQTLEGFTESVRAHRKALDEATEAAKGQARQDAIGAAAAVLGIERLKALTEAQIAYTRAVIETQRAKLSEVSDDRTRFSREGVLNASTGNLDRLEASLGKINSALADARSNADDALGLAIQERVDKLADPIGRIRFRYDELAASTLAASTAAEKENGVLAAKLLLLKQQEAAEIKAAQAAERRTKAASDGVSRFRSREQAIGIAGRELQGQGLRVDGNKQFGVTGGHANDADHNRYAIDVNVGRGTTEANVPDLRSRFDALALSYQKRGYNVIWNGKKYAAFGNGPSGAASGHKDHLHLYAPATIVGRETMASTAAQEAREGKAAATVAEQKADFVSGIVNGAAQRGLGDDRATKLRGRIDAGLAEYQRRFNEAPSPEERAEIVGALTDADAREQAEHFREAYQTPLEDLQLALGKTGIERAVYNAIVAETARKGEALSEAEASQVENTVRMTDAYGRQQAILEAVRQPMEEYRLTIQALNALLREGEIGQAEYNARIAELGTTITGGLEGMPGVDPMTGQSYDQIAQEAEEQARYTRELATFESHKQQLLAIGISYEALIEAAHRRHVNNLNNIDLARKQLAIQAYGNIAESLVSIAENAAGRQSAVYKAMFAVSKAFAIADSIVQIQAALAKALNAPFPQNLVQFGIVAAQSASIVSSIAAVSANFADGGMVRGPGGPRDDAVPINASAGEYIVNARAVSRPGNLALLEAVNSGAATSGLRRATADRAASSSTAGGDNISLSFGDVVVQTGAGTTAEDGEEIGQDVRRALSELVDERIATLQRPGGRLTRTRPSVMG